IALLAGWASTLLSISLPARANVPIARSVMTPNANRPPLPRPVPDNPLIVGPYFSPNKVYLYALLPTRSGNISREKMQSKSTRRVSQGPYLSYASRPPTMMRQLDHSTLLPTRRSMEHRTASATVRLLALPLVEPPPTPSLH